MTPTTAAALTLVLTPEFQTEDVLAENVDRIAAIKAEMDRLEEENARLRASIADTLVENKLPGYTTEKGNTVTSYEDTREAADKKAAKKLLSKERFEAIFGSASERAAKLLSKDEHAAVFTTATTTKLRLS